VTGQVVDVSTDGIHSYLCLISRFKVSDVMKRFLFCVVDITHFITKHRGRVVTHSCFVVGKSQVQILAQRLAILT
jgi:hypothetical protein